MTTWNSGLRINAKRDGEIYRRRMAGDTYKSIATIYGIGPARARQIFEKHHRMVLGSKSGLGGTDIRNTAQELKS